MLSKNFSKNILKTIKEKKIKPIPKYYYLIKNSLFWILFIFLIISGSLSFSFILLELFNADWQIYTKLTNNFLEYLIQIFPIFWIVLLIIIIYLAYIDFLQTEEGYKYNLKNIFLINISISIILGSILYFTNLSHYINHLSFQYLEHPQRIYLMPRENIWMHPEKGLLAGYLIKYINNDLIQIKDFNNKKWFIKINNAQILNQNDIYLNTIIKILGKMINKDTFEAIEIRPWNKTYFHIFIERIYKTKPMNIYFMK